MSFGRYIAQQTCRAVMSSATKHQAQRTTFTMKHSVELGLKSAHAIAPLTTLSPRYNRTYSLSNSNNSDVSSSCNSQCRLSTNGSSRVVPHDSSFSLVEGLCGSSELDDGT